MHPRQQLLCSGVRDEVGGDRLRWLRADDVRGQALLGKGSQRPSGEEEEVKEEAVTTLQDEEVQLAEHLERTGERERMGANETRGCT